VVLVTRRCGLNYAASQAKFHARAIGCRADRYLPHAVHTPCGIVARRICCGRSCTPHVRRRIDGGNFKISKRPACRFKLERARALKFHGGLGAARSDLRASAAIVFERKP